MAGNFQGNQPPLPKTALHEYKLRLSGPQDEGQRRPPTFQVQVTKNNPRITVYTNVEGDKDNGKIAAPMDGVTMFAVLGELERMLTAEPGTQAKVDNLVGPPGKQRIISHTVFGKDKEGRMWIGVIAEGRPKVKFTFKPSDWHHIAHGDGTPYNEAEISIMYCRGWVKLMMELIANVMDTFYVEPDTQNNNRRGGGGGGYNNNNNRGGGYNNSGGGSDGGFDNDDFPM